MIHVDDDARDDPGPSDLTISDPNEDGTEQHPFDSVQEAIEVARDTVRVLVHEGIYRENVDLLGRRITVEGLWLTDPNVLTMPVIEGVGGGPVLRFSSGENLSCQLAGLVITSRPAHPNCGDRMQGDQSHDRTLHCRRPPGRRRRRSRDGV